MRPSSRPALRKVAKLRDPRFVLHRPLCAPARAPCHESRSAARWSTSMTVDLTVADVQPMGRCMTRVIYKDEEDAGWSSSLRVAIGICIPILVLVILLLGGVL